MELLFTIMMDISASVYIVLDGLLELGPSYFAYTDPLTGAWRPKKFEAGELTK